MAADLEATGELGGAVAGSVVGDHAVDAVDAVEGEDPAGPLAGRGDGRPLLAWQVLGIGQAEASEPDPLPRNSVSHRLIPLNQMATTPCGSPPRPSTRDTAKKPRRAASGTPVALHWQSGIPSSTVRQTI